MSDGPTGHEFDNRRHLGHRSWQEQCMMGEGDEGKTREQLVAEVRAFRAETAALHGTSPAWRRSNSSWRDCWTALPRRSTLPTAMAALAWSTGPGRSCGGCPRGSRRPHGG